MADGGFRKRRITKTFYKHRVSAGPLVGPRITHSLLNDGAQIPAPARRARQRGKMDDADECPAVGIENHALFSPIIKKFSSGLLARRDGRLLSELVQCRQRRFAFRLFLALAPAPRQFPSLVVHGAFEHPVMVRAGDGYHMI